MLLYCQESSDSIPQNDGPLPQSTKLHERKGIHGSCTVKGPKNIPQLDGPREESSSEESDESSDSEAEEEAEGVRVAFFFPHEPWDSLPSPSAQ